MKARKVFTARPAVTALNAAELITQACEHCGREYQICRYYSGIFRRCDREDCVRSRLLNQIWKPESPQSAVA
jgi:hypothetical protein